MTPQGTHILCRQHGERTAGVHTLVPSSTAFDLLMKQSDAPDTILYKHGAPETFPTWTVLISTPAKRYKDHHKSIALTPCTLLLCRCRTSPATCALLAA